MTKTSRYKGPVLDSFLVPDIDMIFGDGVGASLVLPTYLDANEPKTIGKISNIKTYSKLSMKQIKTFLDLVNLRIRQ